MTNPYPLPRETRETAPIDGDGRATYGPFAFRIWDPADAVAIVSRAGDVFQPEPITAAKTSGDAFAFFTATFSPDLRPGDVAIVRSARLHERQSDVTRGGTIVGQNLERELSTQGTILQELRRDETFNAIAILKERLDRLAADAEERAERIAAIVVERDARIASDVDIARVRDLADRQIAQIRDAADLAEAQARKEADRALDLRLGSVEGLLGADADWQTFADRLGTRDLMRQVPPLLASSVYLTEAGREGMFCWRPGNFSALVASDPREGVYIESVRPGFDRSKGAWVREGAWGYGADVRWWGYVSDYDQAARTGTDQMPVVRDALAVPGVLKVMVPSGVAYLHALRIPIGKTVEGIPAVFPTFLNAGVQAANLYRPSAVSAGTVWVTNEPGQMDANGHPTNWQVFGERDSLFKNVMGFFDAQPDPTVAPFVPVNSSWFYQTGRSAQNLRDVRCERASTENVYGIGFSHGMKIEKGSEGGVHRRPKMSSLKLGFLADNSHHTVTFEQPEDFPYWSVAQPVIDYTIANAIGFEFGRIDHLKADLLFSIYKFKAVRFVPSRSADFPNQGAYHVDIQSIYADGSTYALVVESGIGPTSLTGNIGNLVAFRTGGAPALPIDEDYSILIKGRASLNIGFLAGDGAGFTRRGGVARVVDANAELHIEASRIVNWDSGNTGIPAFSAAPGGRLSFGSVPQLFNGSTNFIANEKRIYEGDTANGDRNLTLAYQKAFYGIAPGTASRAVMANGATQAIINGVPERIQSQGAREFRWTVRINDGGTPTDVTVGASAYAGLNYAFRTNGGAATTYSSGWQRIKGNVTPRNDLELNSLQLTGSNGAAQLTLLQFILEVRG